MKAKRDYSTLSDEELDKLITAGASSKKDFSTLSDEDLDAKIKKLEPEPEFKSIGDFLKHVISKGSFNSISNTGKQLGTSAGFPESYSEGVAESTPRALANSYSGLSEIFGSKGVKVPENEPSKSFGQSFGRDAGNLGTYGALAVPFAATAEAVLPAAISGLVGAAVAGATLSPGDLKERAREALTWAATTAGLGGIFKGAPKAWELAKSGAKGTKNFASKLYKDLRAPGELEAPLNEQRAATEEMRGTNESAEAEHAQIEEEQNTLKSFLQELYKKNSPEALGNDVYKAEQRFNELEPSAAIKSEQTENLLPGAQGEHLIPEAESKLENAHAKEAEEVKALENYYKPGQEHAKRFAQEINPILEKRQADIGHGYKTYEEGLKGKDVKLPSTRTSNDIIGDIETKINNGEVSSPELSKLVTELKEGSPGVDVPADKFVSLYRTTRRIAHETRMSAYGENDIVFKERIAKADTIKMEDYIDKHLGNENLKELHALNKRYSTEFAPLYGSDFYRALLKGDAGSDIIGKLGKYPHVKRGNPNKVTGTHILNEVVKSNPELTRLALAERYANKKPEAIHEWNEGTERFLEHAPEFRETVSRHHRSNYERQQAEHGLEQAKEQKKTLDTESKRIEESDKHYREQEAKRKDAIKEREKLSEEIRDKKEYIKRQRAISDKKDATYKQKLKSSANLRKAESDLKKLESGMKEANKQQYYAAGKIGLGVLGLGGGEALRRKIRNFM